MTETSIPVSELRKRQPRFQGIDSGQRACRGCGTAIADHHIEVYGLRGERPDALDTEAADTAHRGGGMLWALSAAAGGPDTPCRLI